MSGQNSANEGHEEPSLKRRKLDHPSISFGPFDVKMLETGEYADAEIVCRGKTWKVHRAILCPRSAYFKALLDAKFIEGKPPILTVKDLYIKPDEVEIALKFAYSGTIDLSKIHHDQLMIICNKLAAIADEFMVKGMNEYIQGILGCYLSMKLDLICNIDVLTLDDPHRLELYIENHGAAGFIFKKAFKKLEEEGFVMFLCAAIRDAYVISKTRATQDVFVDFVYAARIHLFKHQDIQKVIQDCPAFGRSILQALMEGPRSAAFANNKTFKLWQDGVTNPAVIIEGTKIELGSPQLAV